MIVEFFDGPGPAKRSRKDRRRVIAASRSAQPKLPSFLRDCPGLLYVCALQHQSRRRHDIVVLDQGLAQAVYSLALLGPAVVPAPAETIELLNPLLGEPPKRDPLIKTDAPAEVVRERPKRRWQRGGRRRSPHSRLELLSRTDSQAVENSMRLIRCIEEGIWRHGWKTIRYCTTDAAPAGQAAERFVQEEFLAQLTGRHGQLGRTEAVTPC